MKKIVFCALASLIMGATLVSCDKDERKCYEITYKFTFGSATTEVTVYEWVSANELDAVIDELKSEHDNVKIISKKVNKDYSRAEDCAAANIRK